MHRTGTSAQGPRPAAARKAVVAAALLTLLGACLHAPAPGAAPRVVGRPPNAPVADLIILGGNVWTGDRRQPKGEAVAVIGSRIVAVGSDPDIRLWRGDETTVVDAGGRLVLPGFNDAHVHFVSGGLQLDSVNLRDAATPSEFARRIGERAKSVLKGEWVLGGDWDEQLWGGTPLPDRGLVDPATPETPVFVNRYDGHMALANSAALQLAGVTAKTPDPPGGAIVRDAQGEPTGLLKDAAMGLVQAVVPPITRERRLRAVRRAFEHAASLGVTSVQDMNPDYADLAAYADLLEQGALTARIYAAPPITRWEDQARLGLRRAFGSPWLRIGALKGYADGSLGSSTAYFFEPFADDPANRGLLSQEMQPPEAMRDRMIRADAAGLQLCLHAIGDQGIAIILDQFAQVARVNGPRERRLRIEHAQHVAAKDFERFAAQEVIASVQPYHAVDDGRWAEKRIGPDRIKTTYAFRTFLDRGVRLALGTDWNVAPLNPMLTVHAAVTRATLDGRNPGGWVPEQKISIREAIEAYTHWSAYAEFQEKEKGTITRGKLADLVILSEDLFAIPPERIRDVRVTTTIVGGRVVWQDGRLVP